MRASRRLLLVDDHPLMLEGLRLQLREEFEIVGMVTAGRDVVGACQELQPDLILLDLGLPDLGGLEVIIGVHAQQPYVRILVVTMYNDRVYADAALEAGAHGFVPKDAGNTELLHAVREVLEGRTYVSDLVPKAAPQFSTAGLMYEIDRLTPRQREIIQLLGEGKTTASVAQELHVSPNTITFHRGRIRKALGITTEWGLMRYAMLVRMAQQRSDC